MTPPSALYHRPCQRNGCSKGWPSISGAGVAVSGGSIRPNAVYA